MAILKVVPLDQKTLGDYMFLASDVAVKRKALIEAEQAERDWLNQQKNLHGSTKESKGNFIMDVWRPNIVAVVKDGYLILEEGLPWSSY